MNKVLIVSPFFPPFEKVGAVKRVEGFVKNLPENHWSPIVLTMDWGYNDLQIQQDKRLYFTRNIAFASWKAYEVADLRAAESWKSILLKKLIRFVRPIKKYLLPPDELVLWALWAVPLSRRVIKSEKPNVIFVTAPPYSSLLTAVILKKMSGLPLVCDIRDDWIGNPLMEKESRFLRFIERRMEQWVVRNSDRVVVMTPASLDLWRSRYPEDKAKICLIENGYNEEEFRAIVPHRFQDFALVHVGSLELNRSPELVYKALSRIGAKGKRIHFYQYGLALRDFQDMASRYGIEDVVHFEGIIKSDEAIARIKGASMLVLLPTQNAPTAIPGKAYEYLRTGKPILMISERNSATEFMNNFPNVYHVEPDDEQRCIDIIDEIYKRKDTLRTDMKGKGIERYDRRKLTKELANVFNLLLEK
ncbi:MAG: glycosyltransferase [Deltaproteobacteria bacterium]|nr:glycosyltransferase [Deltaproteobacteria bacterium]